MSKINLIQNKIKELDGGEYQKLLDSYLYKKYNFSNVVPLGSKDGSNKTTKGIPDSYVINEDGKYILIMYGTVERNTYKKIKKDILDSYNYNKTQLSSREIFKVICCHTSSNITTKQNKELLKLINRVKIELIGIGTLSFDIHTYYPSLAKEFLDISIDSNQISNIDDFVKRYDLNSINAPIDIEYIEREEKKDIMKSIENYSIVLVTGKPGIGKTKLSIEVCKSYLKKHNDTVCLCVRNNGNDIYEDIKDYTSLNNKFLIFIDDINEMRQLNSFMDYVTISNNKNIKIIATIRDYAIKNTISKISKYIEPNIYLLNAMSDDKIKEILEKIYNIKNTRYQEQILKISNGNPRIAVMSAQFIKTGKIKNLNSVVDVFKNFYGKVINDNKINELQLKTLFYISLLGPLRIDNENTKNLLEQLEIYNIDIFKELRKLEIVDFYENKALKICDQNLANYIVYKYLIEDKNISVQILLKIMYPKLVNRFIEAVNMINNIFYSKENTEYIIREINSLWNEEPYNSDSNFLELFHNVNIIKTLSILKEEIRIEKKIKYSSQFLKIDNLKKHNCLNKKIIILSSLKDTEYESSALDLLLQYLEKRPDLLSDFISGLLTNWKINERSDNRNFESEKLLLNKLRDKYIEKNNLKDIYAFIMCEMISEYLQTEIHCSRPGKNNYSILYLTINLSPNEKLFDFRHLIFDLLILLLDDSQFYEKACNLILENHFWSKDEKTKKLLKNDCSYLETNLFSKWKKPNLIESKVLRHYETMCIKLEVDTCKSFKNYLNNNDFLIVMNLEEEYDSNNIKREEIEHKKKILELVSKYSLKDYKRLFNICTNLEKCKINKNNWKVQVSLNIIFTKLIENNVSEFLNVFKAYANYKYPFLVYPSFLSLISNVKSIDKLIDILENNNSNESYYYLKFLYENIINEKYLEKIKMFLISQTDEEKNYTLDIKTIYSYSMFDDNILDEYSRRLIEKNNDNLVINYMNIEAYTRKDEQLIKNIVNSFKKISILEELYIRTLNGNNDYNGLFCFEIIEKDINFLKEITDNNNKFSISTNKFENIILRLWKSSKYNSYITFAYNHLLKTNFGYLDLHKLFENSNDNIICLRQDKWIKKYIDNNIQNNNNIKEIFTAISEQSTIKRKEYILYLLNLNSDINLFKSIYLFSHSETWSGSRIPLIEEKIEFLKEIKKELLGSGIEYIDHIRYIDELINSYKTEISETKLKEYVDDFFR